MKIWTFAAAVLVVATVSCKASDRASVDMKPASEPAPATAGGSGAVGYMADKLSAKSAQAPTDGARLNASAPRTAMPGNADARQGTDSLVPSMIIRTGQAIIYVDSLQVGMARVRDLARRVGGFVANTQVALGADQTHTATLEIKLPSSRWDEAVSGLNPIGKVESVNVSAEDVGEEFVDVAARAVNAHRLEARLIDLLATRTGKLSDIVEIEEKLSQVREEIERMEGRLRYLKTRSAISTLTITVHESLPVVSPHGSMSVIGEAFANAWRGFIGFVAALISSLGVLVPVAALVVGAAVVARRYVRPPVARRVPPKSDEKTDV
ncbi:MAG: DUF4349 domain-containing protein [Gemmatimonadaceae bacterium]